MLVRTIAETKFNMVNYDKKPRASQIRHATCGEEIFRKNCKCSLKGCVFSIKYNTWYRRKCSPFTVEGCSPKTNRVISPIVKYTEKMGPVGKRRSVVWL